MEAVLWPPTWTGTPAGPVGLGMCMGMGEPEELALERSLPPVRVSGPQDSHHVDALIGAPTARGEVDPHASELLAHPAHPDGTPDRGLGQSVDGGQTFGHDHGVVGRENEDAGGQLEAGWSPPR